MPTSKIKQSSFPEGTLHSLMGLALNSFVSMIGASGLSKGLTAVLYFGELLLCGCLLLSYLFGKYLFLYRTNQRKLCFCRLPKNPPNAGFVGTLEHCSEKLCHKDIAYDVFNCIMIFYYLAGDNLKQLVCNPECGQCTMIAQFFTGLSLILNLTLTLLRGAGLGKGNLSSAFPIIGKRGASYDRILQLAASAVTIDQVLTAIVEHFTMETECGTVDNNNRLVQIGFISTYFAIAGTITMFVLLFILCKDRKLFSFDCHDKNVTWQTHCEVFAHWLLAISTALFVAVFMIADIDRFWNLMTDPVAIKAARIVLLLILCFSYSMFLIVFYACFIGIPGMGMILEKKQFFLPEHGMHGVLSTSESMKRRVDNTWYSDEQAALTPMQSQPQNTAWNDNSNSHSTYSDKCQLKKYVEVQEKFGEATISFTFKEEIPCYHGFSFFCKNICAWNVPREDNESQWTMKVDIGETEKIRQLESSIRSTSGSAYP